MDIFDLDIKKFENELDKFLENISEEELFNELINEGLEVDQYNEAYNEETYYYVEDKIQNVWVHKNNTNNKGMKKRKISFTFLKKEKIDLMGAA